MDSNTNESQVQNVTEYEQFDTYDLQINQKETFNLSITKKNTINLKI